MSRAESKARTRQALLSAATSVFLAQGYRSATIADVAAAAGTSVGAIYAHFQSKDGLLLAVIDAVSDSEIAAVRSMTEQHGLGRALAAGIHPVSSQDGAHLVSAELWLEIARNEDLGERLREVSEQRRQQLAEIVALERHRRGDVVWPATDEEVAAVILAIRGGLARHRHDHPGTLSHDLYGRCLEWVFTGLGTLGSAHEPR